jgi:hypothetical protein
MRRLLENEVLDKYQRYQQRLFSSMLRCTRELRMLQSEEIDDEQDQDLQNEATVQSSANVQNEATVPGNANAQNEATDRPAQANPMSAQQLPAVLQQPLAPRSAQLVAATEKVLTENFSIHRMSAAPQR